MIPQYSGFVGLPLMPDIVLRWYCERDHGSVDAMHNFTAIVSRHIGGTHVEHEYHIRNTSDASRDREQGACSCGAAWNRDCCSSHQ